MASNDLPLTLPAVIDRAERLYGSRPAYVDGRRTLSWAELAAESRRVANGFLALGMRPGERVAICAENSIDWIIACHGVARAGGVGVLIYYDLKPDEIARQTRWAECRFFVVSASVLGRLGDRDTGAEVIVQTDGEPQPGAVTLAGLSSAGAAALPATIDPGDLAVIVYTSGTTSGAKGVMLTHRNLLSNAASAQEAMKFGSDDSTLLVLPLHHALPFLAAVVLVSICGAATVIENDLRRIRDRLQEHAPTIFFGVPALYELMYRNVLARAEAEGRLGTLLKARRASLIVKKLTGVNIGPLLFKQVHRALGGRLRFMVSGGAALNPQTARDFIALGLPLLQGWGMTEASPAIALQRFSKWKFRFTKHYERLAGSVGPALPGVEVGLIDVPDKDLRVAVHGEGEVIVRGPNVFAGYWGARQQTAEAMLDGWLRTGDLGRIDADGNIFLTGRSKYIIVLDSGEKVHPDEVEAKMQESELLFDCVVLAATARENKTAVGLIVYPDPEAARKRSEEAGSDLTEATLREMVGRDVERLCKDIATYKRITRVEISDEPLPKTPLRKVARGLVQHPAAFDFEKWLASGPGPAA